MPDERIERAVSGWARRSPQAPAVASAGTDADLGGGSAVGAAGRPPRA
ncbi:hypothetical protein ACF061_04835 [Streptomyces sp. NPDC015220]